MKNIPRVLLFAATSVACFGAEPALRAAKPEEVGMSSERLKRVDAFAERLQAEGKMAGAVTVVARRGRIVSLDAHGFADLEAKRAMRTDDIFHLQSMAKPIAVVAALMLVEEGRFLLSDPVEKFLPEFRDMKVAVAKAEAPDGYELVPVGRPITIHDLLTHRTGFPGVPPTKGPGEALYRKAVGSLRAKGEYTLGEFVHTIAAVPLDAQPGTGFRYSDANTEVLGRVIEVISGATFDVFLRERIFAPLGMEDTFFSVPADKQARVVPAYARSPEKGLVKLPPDPRTTRFFSGGGNLYSTPVDYLRFCQMLLNGGELDGHRLLGRKSIELMTARQLDATAPFMRGQYIGLGVGVLKADGESGLLGSPGTYGWAGSYSTYFRIDPSEKLILLIFAQQASSPMDQELQYGFQNSVMQAIVD